MISSVGCLLQTRAPRARHQEFPSFGKTWNSLFEFESRCFALRQEWRAEVLSKLRSIQGLGVRKRPGYF